MNIIFMGSAAFAVPSLDAIHNSGHKIVLVVAQPDKPAGRGRRLTSPPVANEAKQLGLPLYQPKSVRAAKVIEKLGSYKPDMIVIVAYGKILPKEILEMPKFGCVNLHGSLLPKYRGAAPINWAIVNGETESGVTTMFINEEMDAGDILLKKSVQIGDEDTAITLYDKLAQLGAKLITETISKIEKRTIKPERQNHSQATFAPILKKEDGLIDWGRNAKSIHNLVRGMQPWPYAYTHLDGKLLRILKTFVTDEESTDTPGTIHLKSSQITVSTGDKMISIEELQLEGKRHMETKDFLNGYEVKSGTVLR